MGDNFTHGLLTAAQRLINIVGAREGKLLVLRTHSLKQQTHAHSGVVQSLGQRIMDLISHSLPLSHQLNALVLNIFSGTLKRNADKLGEGSQVLRNVIRDILSRSKEKGKDTNQIAAIFKRRCNQVFTSRSGEIAAGALCANGSVGGMNTPVTGGFATHTAMDIDMVLALENSLRQAGRSGNL